MTRKTQNGRRDPKNPRRFLFPERYVQNIHGYFELNQRFPTKLNLSYSWDPKTVQDGWVYFYAIDDEKGQPCVMSPRPTSGIPPGYEV